MDEKRKANETLKYLRALCKAKGGYSVSVEWDRDYDCPLWQDKGMFKLSRDIGKESASWKDGAARLTVNVPGSCHGGVTSKVEYHTYDGRKIPKYTEPYRFNHGWLSSSLIVDRLRDAIEFLPSDAEITLDVQLDNNTENHINAGLHADELWLHAKFVRRGLIMERSYLLCYSVGLHNTARIGRGENNWHEFDRMRKIEYARMDEERKAKEEQERRDKEAAEGPGLAKTEEPAKEASEETGT